MKIFFSDCENRFFCYVFFKFSASGTTYVFVVVFTERWRNGLTIETTKKKRETLFFFMGWAFCSFWVAPKNSKKFGTEGTYICHCSVPFQPVGLVGNGVWSSVTAENGFHSQLQKTGSIRAQWCITLKCVGVIQWLEVLLIRNRYWNAAQIYSQNNELNRVSNYTCILSFWCQERNIVGGRWFGSIWGSKFGGLGRRRRFGSIWGTRVVDRGLELCWLRFSSLVRNIAGGRSYFSIWWTRTGDRVWHLLPGRPWKRLKTVRHDKQSLNRTEQNLQAAIKTDCLRQKQR